MERYLDKDFLAGALGKSEGLPTKEALSKLIADTEIGLLANTKKIENHLIQLGWYFFTIASIKGSYELYGIERQKAAYQVAAQIFDLALASGVDDQKQKLRLIFASQIAYIKSQHQPNAVAIRKKHLKVLEKYPVVPDHYQDIALMCGIAFLGFDNAYIYDATYGIENQAAHLVDRWNVSSLSETPLGSSYALCMACRSFISFLIYGSEISFTRAKDFLLQSILSKSSYEDSDCKWMATLLLNLADDLYKTSVWKVFPAEIPPSIKRAFTLGVPRVLTLWPPQIDYLSSHNPFSDEAKFQFLSTPTSGGKTLLAQVLITHHLSARLSSACYIAPTRSLCREVANAMQNRLRYLNLKSQHREFLEEYGLSEEDILEPSVDIMTPESLANLIRRDPNAVFQKYGLFVFDEVHSVGDASRGWVLEQTIALINTIANAKDIRIAMISAVIGNRNHFVSWLEAGEKTVLQAHSTWRGPRRISAIWSTIRKGRAIRQELMRTGKRSKFNKRNYYNLFGQLTVRTSLTGENIEIQSTAPIGELVMKQPIFGGRGVRDNTKSLTHNKALLPIVTLLASRGPVLCIESTKKDAVGLAKTIADSRVESESEQTQTLVKLIEAKLSSAHPLSRVVQKGVAYHHGSLPSDIRVEIEKAVVEGTISILVSTTTMTEGVNLPVQAVIISKDGSYQDNQEFLKFIKGPKMANAIGRAGRATQETEGCVVLFNKGRTTPETFRALDPDDQEKNISSNLVTEEFLAELAAFEALRSESEDALFECKTPILSGFLSFIWFYLYTISITDEPNREKVTDYLKNTMAWLQGSDELKQSLQQLCDFVIDNYRQYDAETHRVYAKSSAKLGTTRILRHVYFLIKDELIQGQTEIELIKSIITDSTLTWLLSVSEAPTKLVYDKRSGRRKSIEVPVISFLEDWINGLSYPQLAEKYLSEVADVDFRFEQVGEFIANYFDNFLPWVVGTIMSWAIEEKGDVFPSNLPGLIRGGVPNEVAFLMLQQGIYSRQLAIGISLWQAEEEPGSSGHGALNLLRRNTIEQLIEALNPNSSELGNLIEFVAQGGSKILSGLTHRGSSIVEIWRNEETTSGECLIKGNGTTENYWLELEGLNVGLIPTQLHVEMRTLLNSGIPYNCLLRDDLWLEITVDEFEEFDIRN